MSAPNIFLALEENACVDATKKDLESIEKLMGQLNFELITKAVNISEKQCFDEATWSSIHLRSLYRQALLLNRISREVMRLDDNQLSKIALHQNQLFDTFRCSALLTFIERLLRRVTPGARYQNNAIECSRAFASLFVQTEILVVDFNNRSQP